MESSAHGVRKVISAQKIPYFRSADKIFLVSDKSFGTTTGIRLSIPIPLYTPL